MQAKFILHSMWITSNKWMWPGIGKIYGIARSGKSTAVIVIWQYNCQCKKPMYVFMYNIIFQAVIMNVGKHRRCREQARLLYCSTKEFGPLLLELGMEIRWLDLWHPVNKQARVGAYGFYSSPPHHHHHNNNTTIMPFTPPYYELQFIAQSFSMFICTYIGVCTWCW